jgi:hypothetical protein
MLLVSQLFLKDEDMIQGRLSFLQGYDGLRYYDVVIMQRDLVRGHAD